VKLASRFLRSLLLTSVPLSLFQDAFQHLPIARRRRSFAAPSLFFFLCVYSCHVALSSGPSQFLLFMSLMAFHFCGCPSRQRLWNHSDPLFSPTMTVSLSAPAPFRSLLSTSRSMALMAKFLTFPPPFFFSRDTCPCITPTSSSLILPNQFFSLPEHEIFLSHPTKRIHSFLRGRPFPFSPCT